ncbi:MAG TPA: spore coat protein CotH, partial [Alicycliphilus sp.]|nr:spore coat protein CotH [Alicycliphilus sp.]HRM49684.1 spore coat protein CotH [Alicycliphilus sp.]HRN64085.1 spore coat protein CotH [Alicycliphilus sp.]
AFADGTLVLQPAPVSGRTLLNLGALPAGQYLVRVTASDADGNRSNAFDSTSFDGQTVDGAICLNMPGATPC